MNRQESVNAFTLLLNHYVAFAPLAGAEANGIRRILRVSRKRPGCFATYTFGDGVTVSYDINKICRSKVFVEKRNARSVGD